MVRWFPTFGSNPFDDAFSAYLKKAKKRTDRRWESKVHNTAKLSDFELIRTLGFGTFGRVMLARHIAAENKPYYAVKIMSKRKILLTNHLRHALNEKRILYSVKFPFLVRYMYHFKDNANLFLVMEYVAGGDMFTVLRRMGRFDETLARFYAAQVGLAFEYLHYVGIVYRDLKPENIVVDVKGFLKITDFGFAKKIDRGKTTTICGTPEYYAPEMIKQQSYSFSVDWWTLGVLLYEMMTGKPPFRSSSTWSLFRMIVTNKPSIPAYFSKTMTAIVTALMQTDVKKRPQSLKEVRRHEFFLGVDWLRLVHRQVLPPHVPVVESEHDTSNFDLQDEQELEQMEDDVYAAEFEEY